MLDQPASSWCKNVRNQEGINGTVLKHCMEETDTVGWYSMLLISSDIACLASFSYNFFTNPYSSQHLLHLRVLLQLAYSIVSAPALTNTIKADSRAIANSHHVLLYSPHFVRMIADIR